MTGQVFNAPVKTKIATAIYFKVLAKIANLYVSLNKQKILSFLISCIQNTESTATTNHGSNKNNE